MVKSIRQKKSKKTEVDKFGTDKFNVELIKWNLVELEKWNYLRNKSCWQEKIFTYISETNFKTILMYLKVYLKIKKIYSSIWLHLKVFNKNFQIQPQMKCI